MAVRTCLVLVFAVTSLGGATEVLPAPQESLLISGDPVLADVNQVQVVLATEETRDIERSIEPAKLKAQVEQMLRDGGLRPVERVTGAAPCLIVHIEGIEVPGSDKWVYRIQTSLDRGVTVPGRGNRRIVAEVWRVRPVMAATTKAEAGNAISAAVLVQADAFVGVWKASRRSPVGGEDAKKNAGETMPPGQSQGSLSVGAYPFIASKSGSVFHRPDCRWAQNIAANNLVGYKTREEAVQAGKRPCKSCQP